MHLVQDMNTRNNVLSTQADVYSWSFSGCTPPTVLRSCILNADLGLI